MLFDGLLCQNTCNNTYKNGNAVATVENKIKYDKHFPLILPLIPVRSENVRKLDDESFSTYLYVIN